MTGSCRCSRCRDTRLHKRILQVCNVVFVGIVCLAVGVLCEEETICRSSSTRFDDDLPCTIPRFRRLSADVFADEFRNARPFILQQGLHRNEIFRDRLALERMLESYGAEKISLGTANSYTGRVSKKSRLDEYVNNYMGLKERETATWGNESWYLFGDNPEPFWNDLLEDYVLPSVLEAYTIVVDPLIDLTPVVGLGGVHSGVPFHTHGDGWSEVIHGRKRWFLFPEGIVPEFDTQHTQYKWTRDVYASMNATLRDSLFECVLEPGDALYFPSNWYHATLNLDPYTAFVSVFS